MKNNFFEQITKFFENGKTNLDNNTDISDINVIYDNILDDSYIDDEDRIASGTTVGKSNKSNI